MIKVRISKVSFIFLLLLSLTFFGEVSGISYARADEGATNRFIFAGHVRGGETYKINGLLPSFCREVSHVKKDFVFIGGDIIFGYENSYDEEGLNKEWQMVDDHLEVIDAPVYRIPGNHDWHSLSTKEVYNEKYGSEYYSFKSKDLLVVALNTSILHPDKFLDWARFGAYAPGKSVDLARLDDVQENFLKNEVKKAEADDSINHVVIFMPYLLWESEEWQNEIHPMLSKYSKVRMVISGDASGGWFDIIEKNGIFYTNCGWSIVDDDKFSPEVFYLYVILQKDSQKPEILIRYVKMDQDFIPHMSAYNTDTSSSSGMSMEKRIKGYICRFLEKILKK